MFASKLRAPLGTAAIRDKVMGVARGIDAAIQIAHTDGFSKAVVDLPTNVSLAGMTPSEARLVLYAELVKLYSAPEGEGGRGFPSVRVSVTGQPQIIIGWKNGLADEDFDEYNEILHKHRVKPPKRRDDSY